MLLNIFPFSRFMTDRAQGNKVIQVVCKLVIGKFGKKRRVVVKYAAHTI